MLKHIQDEGKYVALSGFRDVRIDDAKMFVDAVRVKLPRGVEVQFFDADLVATWQHLYFAVVEALMSLRTGRNVSKSAAVEVMLYAAAKRQIRKAVEFIGVKSGLQNVAVVVLAENASSAEEGLSAAAKTIEKVADESVLELSETKTPLILREFDVSSIELESAGAKSSPEQALVDSVIERVALLSTHL